MTKCMTKSSQLGSASAVGRRLTQCASSPAFPRLEPDTGLWSFFPSPSGCVVSTSTSPPRPLDLPLTVRCSLPVFTLAILLHPVHSVAKIKVVPQPVSFPTQPLPQLLPAFSAPASSLITDPSPLICCNTGDPVCPPFSSCLVASWVGDISLIELSHYVAGSYHSSDLSSFPLPQCYTASQGCLFFRSPWHHAWHPGSTLTLCVGQTGRRVNAYL